jgi:hypothetical protein
VRLMGLSVSAHLLSTHRSPANRCVTSDKGRCHLRRTTEGGFRIPRHFSNQLRKRLTKRQVVAPLRWMTEDGEHARAEVRDEFLPSST